MDILLPDAPFRTRDAASLGLRRTTLVEARRLGLLRHPVRGVLLRADLAEDPVWRAKAVAMALPPGAAVGRSLAAWMHGVDARAPWERTRPLVVECVVPRGTEPPKRPDVVAHVDLMGADDVCTVDGVPVTSPARTAMDLARFLPPHMGLAVLDALVARHGLDLAVLTERIEAWRRQRGVAQARRLIELCDPAAESFGESWLRLRIVDAGFSRPTLQIWIEDDRGRRLYRLDLGWPERRIAVEYDGVEFHDSPEQRRNDIRRRRDLEERFGWTVIGVGRGEVLGRSLELERGVGELLGQLPQTLLRTW